MTITNNFLVGAVLKGVPIPPAGAITKRLILARFCAVGGTSGAATDNSRVLRDCVRCGRRFFHGGGPVLCWSCVPKKPENRCVFQKGAVGGLSGFQREILRWLCEGGGWGYMVSRPLGFRRHVVSSSKFRGLVSLVFGGRWDSSWSRAVSRLVRRGLVIKEGGILRLSEKGRGLLGVKQ